MIATTTKIPNKHSFTRRRRKKENFTYLKKGNFCIFNEKRGKTKAK